MTHSLPDTAQPIEVAGTVGVSPKALAATVAPILLGVILSGGFALLDWLLGNPEVLAALPVPVQILAVAALSSLAASLAAYRARPGVVLPGTPQNGSQG